MTLFTTDKPARRRIDDVLREAWLGALGALSSAEGELHRLGDRLREAAFGDESLAADVLARIRQSRAQLEQRVDDGVRAALARAIAPVRAEIAAVNERMERLQKRIADETRRRAERRQGPPASPRPGSTEGTP